MIAKLRDISVVGAVLVLLAAGVRAVASLPGKLVRR